jgi:hypothetical protein
LGALAQAYFRWWEQALASGLREQVQTRYFCNLGVAWGYGVMGVEVEMEVEVVVLLNGWNQERSLPKDGILDGFLEWNCSQLPSNQRELRTVVEILKREEVVYNKNRGMMVVYLTDNEVTYNIFKKGSSKTLSLHILVQQLKALELALGCRLEVIHVPGRDHYDHTGHLWFEQRDMG